MMFFLLLVILIIFMVFLFFAVAIKINFIFDTNKEDMKLIMLWLDPFLKAVLYMKNKKPILEVYLFQLKLFKKTLKMKKKASDGIQFNMKNLNLEDVHLTAKYGFQDKFMVGIICGMLHFISQIVQIDYLEQNPDFMAEEDYVYLNATANLKIMPTLKSLVSH